MPCQITMPFSNKAPLAATEKRRVRY